MAGSIATIVPGTTPTILFKCTVPAGVDLHWSTNGNTGDIYLGGPTVSSTNFALWLDKKATGSFFIPYGETVWAIASNGTDDVHVGAWV